MHNGVVPDTDAILASGVTVTVTAVLLAEGQAVPLCDQVIRT